MNDLIEIENQLQQIAINLADNPPDGYTINKLSLLLVIQVVGYKLRGNEKDPHAQVSRFNGYYIDPRWLSEEAQRWFKKEKQRLSE